MEDGDSRLFCLPLDQFRFEGPNESRLCFVYPVAGPQASRIPPVYSDPDRMLRRASLQTAHATVLLHKHGICHSGMFCRLSLTQSAFKALWLSTPSLLDLTPANILLCMSSLDGLSECEIIQLLGEPKIAEVSTYSVLRRASRSNST